MVKDSYTRTNSDITQTRNSFSFAQGFKSHPHHNAYFLYLQSSIFLWLEVRNGSGKCGGDYIFMYDVLRCNSGFWHSSVFLRSKLKLPWTLFPRNNITGVPASYVTRCLNFPLEFLFLLVIDVYRRNDAYTLLYTASFSKITDFIEFDRTN